MKEAAKLEQQPTQKKVNRARTLGAIYATTVWLAAIAAYLVFGVGWEKLKGLEPNAMGDMLAGFAAPLAFLWLVVGYFQQGEELELQRDELALQREATQKIAAETRRQADAIALNELHARKDSFSRLREILMRELDSLAYEIAVHLVSSSTIQSYAKDLGLDLVTIAKRMLYDLLGVGSRAEFERKRNGYPAWDRDFNTYCDIFEHLIEEADLVDPFIRSVLERTMDGNIYAGLANILGRYIRLKREDRILVGHLGLKSREP